MDLRVKIRQVGKVTILDLSGKITIAEGGDTLREAVYEELRKGSRRIILNLADVSAIDSAGLGQMVAVFTSTRNNGGTLKLLHLMQRVQDLLVITKLLTVFDVEDNEDKAVASFDK